MTLNLISGAWIPVRRRDGVREFIRPAQVVDEAGRADGNHAVFPDWPRPDLNIATLEFLIGLLSVAMPPRNFGQWIERWKAPPSVDELDEALAPYASAFDLDGYGPRFMQDFDELEGEPVRIDGLFIDSAGESTVKKNADLMVKRQRYDCLSRSSAAIALYALQQFAPAGGAGHRTSMRGGGPLTTLALPPSDSGGHDTLWHIVWANVRQMPDGSLATADMTRMFPWLDATRTSEKGQVIHEGDEPTAHHYFGMARRIRLVFEENHDKRPCALTGEIDDSIVTGYITRPYGINYGQWQHPLTPYYRKTEGDQEQFAMHPPAGRFGYRNWVAVVAGDEKQKTRIPAETITNSRDRFANAPREFLSNKVQLLIAGWAMNNMKPLDYILAEQPLHLAADAKDQEKLDDFARRMVGAAQSASTMLIGAIQAALKAGRDAPKADSAKLTAAREAFFAGTENDFHDILGQAAASTDLADGWDKPHAKTWLTAVQRVAFDVFDATVQPDPSDPNRARKVVEARRKLTAGLLYAKGEKSLRGILGIPIPVKVKSKTKGTAS